LPVFAIIFITVWAVIPESYQGRFKSIENRENDMSYQNRVRAWHAGWEMFKDYPITGVGTGVFPNANGAEYWPGAGRKIWLQPHSLYVQLLAEQGILGVIAFVAFLISVFSGNLKLRRALKDLKEPPTWASKFPLACTLIFLVLLFTGYSGHSLYRHTWYMMAALTAALTLLVEQNAFGNKPEEPSGTADTWDSMEIVDEPQPAN
jgi:O-antigen ligase